MIPGFCVSALSPFKHNWEVMLKEGKKDVTDQKLFSLSALCSASAGKNLVRSQNPSSSLCNKLSL